MRGAFDTIGFLQLYRSSPVLWDRNHPDYRNRPARLEAETTMMESFGFDSVRDVRHKIRILRNTYNLELQRINTSIKNGADSGTVYTPKLVWFALADSFLGKNVDADDSSMAWEDSDKRHEYEDLVTSGAEHRTVSVKKEPARKKRKEDKRKKHSFVSYEPGPSYQSSEEMVGANEFVVFGQHVAIQLEKLPLDVSLRLQSDIQGLLTKARLETLRHSDYQVEYLQEQDPISSEETN